MLKLIVFDLDGTLVDTRHDIANSVNFTLNAFDMPARSLEEITAAVGHGIENLIRKCLPENHREGPKITKILECYRTHYRDHCCERSKTYAGVEGFFENVRSLKFSVLSNKPEEYCRILLDCLNLSQLFNPIFGGDSSNHKKPHPAGLKAILEQLGVAPDEAMMVGDSAPDVEAGQRAGTATVGILNGMGDSEQMLQSGPAYAINSFHELENLLKKDYMVA